MDLKEQLKNFFPEHEEKDLEKTKDDIEESHKIKHSFTGIPVFII